jgi:serine protease SohB
VIDNKWISPKTVSEGLLEFLYEFGLFFAKAATLVFAIALVVGILTSTGIKAKKGEKGHLEIKHLSEQISKMRNDLADHLLGPAEKKQAIKQRKKSEKAQAKNKDKTPRKRVFVLNFKGDIKAAAVESLREEITAILGQATASDEVVLKLESPGGMVHSYGLAASQLDRIKKAGIPLTVCVDKVAASGGYMMACVADKILAAPFSLIGSIGVVAQLPNFHRLLKKHDVDYEVLTAGEYKRTLTILGENTEQGREKFLDDLQETHHLFKQFVSEHRQELDIDSIATGEVWLGTRAQALFLVDEISTSDEYLLSQLESADIFEVHYVLKKTMQEKIGLATEETVDGLLMRWLKRFYGRNYFT